MLLSYKAVVRVPIINRLSMQWCIEGSVRSTSCMMDSSSLGTRRRVGHDTTNMMQQGPACSDAIMLLAATLLTCFHMSHYVHKTISMQYF